MGTLFPESIAAEYPDHRPIRSAGVDAVRRCGLPVILGVVFLTAGEVPPDPYQPIELWGRGALSWIASGEMIAGESLPSSEVAPYAARIVTEI